MVTHGSDMWQWPSKIALFGADFCWENRGFGVSQCSNKPKTSHWRPWKTCWESGWNTFSFKILSNWFQVFSTQISVNHFTCIIEGGPYWPSWTKKNWQRMTIPCSILSANLSMAMERPNTSSLYRFNSTWTCSVAIATSNSTDIININSIYII